MDPKLLNKVRRMVLIWVATRRPYFGLSEFCMYVKGDRGHIHRCLSLLAKEGIMYERSHTERGVASYEHSETDKRFGIRITKESAILLLDKEETK